MAAAAGLVYREVDRMTCCLCSAVAHYQVGNRGFCREHKDQAWAEEAKQAQRHLNTNGSKVRPEVKCPRPMAFGDYRVDTLLVNRSRHKGPPDAGGWI